MPAALASRLAAGWSADPSAPGWRELRGSAVLADISGFTGLTERLTRTGDEGVEVLHGVLTMCFSAVLGGAVEMGGDVLGFAGDAALVWFGAEEHPDHLDRAVSVAVHMPSEMASIPASLTGGRRLRASIGVHTGAFLGVMAGEARKALFLCGPNTTLLAQLETAARPGQVVASDQVVAARPDATTGVRVGPGHELRLGTRGRPIPPRPATLAAPELISPAGLVSPRVLELMDGAGMVESHRAVSVAFVSFDGVDDVVRESGAGVAAAAIDGVARVVSQVCDDEWVEWLDVDVGPNAVRFVLAAGAPTAVERDEERLLVAVRRIIDDSAVPMRAGAQRGKVFSALLGVPERLSFTVLGDPVNVAARAMARAAPGELVVGDGMGVAGRRGFRVAALGPQQLKNRRQPMAMWSVHEVARQGSTPLGRAVGSPTGFRHRESEALGRAWKRAVDEGAGCAVALVGEPGMGAAELIDELTASAVGRSTSVVIDPTRRHVPFAGLRAIVAAVAAVDHEPQGGVTRPIDPWATLAARSGSVAPHLRPWVSQALRAAAQDVPDGSTPRPLAQRDHVVLAALVSALLPRPWLIAVHGEDLLDDASRSVLAQLRSHTGMGSLVLLTSRRPSAPGPFADDVVLELLPLPDDEAAELVIAVRPQLRDDTLRRIVRAGGGNPFVLGELARHPIDGELPDSLQRLGAWLIDSLSTPARALVRDVSIFGGAFDREQVATVLGRPELAASEEWFGCEPILRVAPDDRLVFRHEAYRRVAYESLPFRRRRELHGLMADHLLAVSDGIDAAVAAHLQQAGRAAEAYPRLARAGRAAKASGAVPEAIDLLARAATLARAEDRPQLAALLLDEGEARHWVGDFVGAEDCYRRAGRCATEPLDLGRLCHLRADLALHDNRLRSAERWARRGLAETALLADTATGLRCQLMLDRAARLDAAGRPERSLSLAQTALEWAMDAGLEMEEGLAHLHLEMSYSLLLDPRAEFHGERAVELFERLGDERRLYTALINTGLTAMYFGRFGEAIRRYEHAMELAERCGNAVHLVNAITNLGFVLLRQGRLEEAGRHARRALRPAEAVGVGSTVGVARLLVGMIAAADGRFAEAAGFVADARRAYHDVGNEAMVVDCDVTAMSHLVMAGRHAEAIAAGRALAVTLSAAEPELLITYGRSLGMAEAAMGMSGDGVGASRVRGALDDARRSRLRYEEHECLSTLVRIAERGGPSVSAAEVTAMGDLAAMLGLVG